MSKLFTPMTLGRYALPHRVVLAPKTRLRTIQPGDIPSPMMADFYDQRASRGGLVIIEGVSISIIARSYLGAASFFHDGQMAGWKAIAEAVHAKGGRAFMQLIHGGRQSHVDMTGGLAPVAPFVVPFEGVALTEAVWVPVSPHRALDAGFDGIELYGADGYLVDQFIQDGANRRTGDYGGPVENWVRFLRGTAEALSLVWGAGRVGVANTVLFSMRAQLAAAAAIDQWGLLGAPVRSRTALRSTGIAVVVAALALSQFGTNATRAVP